MKTLKNIIRSIIPHALKEQIKQYRIRTYQKTIAGKSTREVFDYIYEENIWGTKDVPSGSGSTLEQATRIIEELPAILNRYQIHSILDVPCGDFNWMKELDLRDVRYTGGDIVQKLVQVNNKKYAKNNVAFVQLNIIEDPLPKTDLLLCRDCFIHLSIDQVIQSLKNIRASEINYLLTTSYMDITNNVDIMTGEWRPVNMERPPFNLVAKDRIIENSNNGKSLILVEL